MENETISVAIVDDHTLFRKGIASLLAEFKEITILFEAANGIQLRQKISDVGIPQVILMDINMPLMDGYESTSWLKTHHPEVKVLALSMFEDDQPVIRMLRCGAGGYLLKESKPVELLSAIQTIHKHSYYLNEMVSGKLIRSLQGDANSDSFKSGLSPNEATFLTHCCSELTYKEIADQMNLSPYTIDNYRDALFKRYQIKSRTGLALLALQHELVDIKRLFK
ncbi:two component transcriptional regulator, LuxR family [Mucilaginibacter mallensis]|uniref:Two component transcriptional regulator, LuxR family n=1 Tax=Mucilaginibacter mallensis TaxID=652787 RepID=A0A1H2BDC4_MUCMA|nr:response regulator transcription factor [Mucilaginibacter mallensis]SDT56263.1 two component transcriptional regulator, LuxR family [Mucilaginibacter mallensis]